MNAISARRGFLVFLVIMSGVLAWQRYFIQDDAFISFTYARNFADGHGLVWYPGSNEFGYTNFLFTLLVGCLIKLGVDAPVAAMVLSIPAYIASMVLVFLLTEMLSQHKRAAQAAAIVTATGYTVSSYATGGLETSLHMFLIILTYVLSFAYGRNRSPAWPIAVSSSLALLCRLDSALLLLPAYAYLAICIVRKKTGNSLGDGLVLLSVPAGTLAAFLSGCYLYYSAAFPNTFYAKLVLVRNFYPEGWAYLKSFLRAEIYYPVVMLYIALASALIAISLKITRHPFSLEIICLFCAVAIWLGYIVHMGGDFMEFRLLVPLLPLFYAACFALLANSMAHIPAFLWATITMAGIAVGFYHQSIFRPNFLPVTSIPMLNSQVAGPENNWQMVGKALGRLFYTGSPDDVTIAVHTAGAIPYYSQLPSIDIYGLNDRWVAMNGIAGSSVAGHRRMAPFPYLVKRKVNIIFPGLPVYACGPDARNKQWPPYNSLPVLLIPLENGCSVVGYYLAPHPRIDSLIRDGQITMAGH